METTHPRVTTKTGIEISNPGAPPIGRSPRGKSRPARPNRQLKEIRINAGLSRNQLGRLCDPQISGLTIRNAEELGTYPHEQNQLAIARALNAERGPDEPELRPTNLFPPKPAGSSARGRR
jgi:hypothetical protein